jgi:peptidoglycan/LPS O-acetylase OafA/YrhL
VGWRTTEAGSATIIAVTFALSLLLTLPLAALSWRLVERPANALGRRLAGLIPPATARAPRSAVPDPARP